VLATENHEHIAFDCLVAEKPSDVDLCALSFGAENFQKNGNYISLASCAIKVGQVARERG